MKKTILALLLFIGIIFSYGQKTVFTPTEWSNTGHEYYNRMSPDRMYQSANFVLYWGDLVGTNPQNASDAGLRFSPQAVADTFEVIFKRYITDLKFINNAATTNFGKYKTPVIILGTFSGGDDRTTGFAHASSYSNTIGAMFVHPAAVKDGGAISHEYAHALQMMMRIQENPGNGRAFAGYDWAGPFFEGHANFMRAQAYQKWANIDGTLTRWIQTRHFMWSSNRHHYTNYNLLFYVQEKEGFDFTRRMWAESMNSEHPIETIKRLKGFTQEQLNDYLWGYAAKDVTFDYPIQWNSQVNQNSNFGKVIRSTYQAIKNQMPRYTSRQYTLLTKVAGTTDRYYTNDDWAPQDYGMNIIPLYPTCTGTQKPITVKFKGHTEVNTTQAGWRYGFVTTKADGTVSRYSPMYASADGEASFTLDASTESGIYFVVFSAPKAHVNYNMDVGYPKQRRYPYELKIANANPEGYQPAAEFRSWLKTNGKIHSNGGGWISNNANVAATAYVGPYAIVKGGTVSGTARIEDWATVEGGNISGNAIVRGNACVYNATISASAIVEGNAWMEGGSVTNTANMKGNALCWSAAYSGTVVVGGDAEVPSCANGVYLQAPYWRNGRTDCDGKGATDASNVDINSTFTVFTDAQMNFSATPSCSGTTTNTNPTVTLTAPTNNTAVCAGTNITLTATATDADGTISKVEFFNGSTLLGTVTTSPYTFTLNNATAGTYTISAKATDNVSGTATSTTATVTVNTAPLAPTVTSPVTYCQNATPAALTATGTSLKWYTVATGGTASTTAITPTTNTVATTTYYVSQTTNNCESPRAAIVVTVNTLTTWYADADGDGVGDGSTTQLSCTQPNGYVAVGGDQCPNDANKSVPGNCGCGKTEQSCIDCNNVVNGGAVLDNCSRCTGGTTNKTACTSMIQAENTCEHEGTVDNATTSAGFTGTGYVNTTNTTNVGVKFVVSATITGTGIIGVRYANNGSIARTAIVKVNGTQIAQTYTFALTGAWTTWLAEEQSINFAQGNNTVEILSNTADGLPNMDLLYFISSNLKEGSCTVITSIQNPSFTNTVTIYPNPSQSAFQIILNDAFEYSIYDIMGKEVEKGQAIDQISIGEALKTGIYTIKILQQGNTDFIKITKQ